MKKKTEFILWLVLMSLFFITGVIFFVIGHLLNNLALLQVGSIFEMICYFVLGLFIAGTIGKKYHWLIFIAVPIIILEHYFFVSATHWALNYLLPVGLALVLFYIGFILRTVGFKDEEENNTTHNNH